jgi:hypothetical protein
MRDISYFQEYERRRARANNPIIQDYSTGTATVIGTGLGLTGSGVTINPHPSMYMYTTTASLGSSYTSVAYPRYRLEKTYTFIGEVRVLQDAHLQMQEAPGSEWVDASQTFNSYS